VRHAIVHATLIEILALLPVFFLGGLSGAFFQPLAISYSLSLAASMIVALTVTPALALMLVPEGIARPPVAAREVAAGLLFQGALGDDQAAGGRLRDHRHHLAGRSVRRTEARTVAAARLQGTRLPHALAHRARDVREGGGAHHLRGVQELSKIPGVRNFGSHIGQALIMDEVYGVYFGRTGSASTRRWTTTRRSPPSRRRWTATRASCATCRPISRSAIREVLTGSPTAITVRIFGDDLPTIRAKADELKHAFEDIPGLVDLKVESLKEIAQIDVKVDLAAAERYGVKPGDVRREPACSHDRHGSG
jgi:multidrug efflux pump subunit AcrB